MKKEIVFTKAVASGNDFIIIDNFKLQTPNFELRTTELAKELCQRKLSIGADGLLLIERSKNCDFKMRIFNPDGSEAQMCGNGIRCVALYAAKEGISRNSITIETKAGELSAQVKQDKVKVTMSLPKDLKIKFDLDVNGQKLNVNFINTGVPHVVCFVKELDNFDLAQMGRAIRYHFEFQPEGTNANFVQVLDKDHIRLRTYERGVEEETLACGTGAVAASIITAYQMEKPQGQYKVKVETKGKDRLLVYFNIAKEKIEDVY